MSQDISAARLTWDELHEIAADPTARIRQRFIAYKQMLINYSWYFEYTNDYAEWLEGRDHCIQLRELRADLAKIGARETGKLYKKYCPWR